MFNGSGKDRKFNDDPNAAIQGNKNKNKILSLSSYPIFSTGLS
jgi:hypothetical protein